VNLQQSRPRVGIVVLKSSRFLPITFNPKIKIR
jgi:hypothetical protein